MDPSSQDAAAEITLSKLAVFVGGPASLLCVIALILGVVMVVRALAARRRGDPTTRFHWYLGAWVRVLVIASVVNYLLGMAGTFNEFVRLVNEHGISRGAADHLVVELYNTVPKLLVPLASALLLAFMALFIGAPRDAKQGTASAAPEPPRASPDAS